MAPSIHGDSAAGLLLVLVGTGSLAVRLLRRPDPVPVEPAGRL
jgi:hypothetical protein